MTERMLFLQFSAEWTAGQIESLIDTLDGATPEDVGIIAVPDDVDYLSEDEAEQFINELTDALNQE